MIHASQAWVDAPGVLHRIMVQGKQSRKIFMDGRQGEDFLERLFRRFELNPPPVRYSVERGEAIAPEERYGLIE